MLLLNKVRVRGIPRSVKESGVAEVRLVIPFNSEHEGLKKYQLNVLKAAGDRMLPPSRGPATRRNIEGRVITHRDRPKERRYWQVLWGREQFCGRGETEWVEDYVTRSRMCFPRTLIPAEGVEISLIEGEEGILLAGIDPVLVTNEERLIVAINVMLEIFGACWIIESSKTRQSISPIRRVNWRLLPTGKCPWSRIRDELNQITGKGKPDDKVMRNLEKFHKSGAEQVIIGQGGFEGYVGFLYPKRSIVILESVHPNNATYIFSGNDWERLTRLTKAELIEGGLHLDRLIHDDSWASRVRYWLPNEAA